jgi:hypothetical protein
MVLGARCEIPGKMQLKQGLLPMTGAGFSAIFGKFLPITVMNNPLLPI